MITSLREYKSHSFILNVSSFEEFVRHNRAHQNEARDKAIAATIGQVISPCGTGKTRIQIRLHVEKMIQKTYAKEVGTFVIASHRLSLNHQLLDQLVSVAIPCGLSFDILCIGSDRDDTSKYYVKYAPLGYTRDVSRHLTSLSSHEIELFITRAHGLGRHVLVVSTYNSIDRLSNVGKIDIVTHDEAQNIPRQDFTNNIKKVKPNILTEYFFTATRKTKANGGGMDDESFYGPILADIKPQRMLEEGEIATPRIHLVRGTHAETTNTTNLTMLVKSTVEAFSRHREQIKKDSISPEDVGAKVIVGCIGIESMIDVYFHPSTMEYATTNNVPCFAISSDGAYVNWQKTTYEEFFRQLYALSDGEDAFIFNVDMLTEGIDLPSITGVMPMRSLGVIKLIQLLGRAVRLYKKDRARLYAGEITPSDCKKMVKPYGHLILPEHLNSLNEYEEMKRIIRLVYAEYGTPVEELVIQDKFIDMTPDDLKPMTKRDFGDGKRYELEHDIVDIRGAVLEDMLRDKVNSMTGTSAIDYILSLSEEKLNV